MNVSARSSTCMWGYDYQQVLYDSSTAWTQFHIEHIFTVFHIDLIFIVGLIRAYVKRSTSNHKPGSDLRTTKYALKCNAFTIYSKPNFDTKKECAIM